MTDDNEAFVDCTMVGENLTDLALGSLSGRERSLVLAHLATCEKCARELEQITAVIDNVLLLAPAVEPPVGFELRLSERLQANRSRSRGLGKRQKFIFGVAAAIILALGVGIGELVDHGNTPMSIDNADLTSALLTMNGQDLGEAIISNGKPGWLFMSIDHGSTSGVAWCEVTLANGKVIDIGKFRLTNGYGTWAAPLSVSSSNVVGAEVTGEHGNVLATARLR